MAIQTECPHCHKAYRLKDELAGKRVTCGNPECRKPFTVNPSANGANGAPAKSAARPKPAARPAAPPPDVEAAAAALFAEEGGGPAVPEDQRKITITCASCDHKWEVPWSMQGKNVLCPECRHRQKVPEQKAGKIDWRDPKAGRPSMAKVEELEGAVGTVDVRHVSGGALKEAGVLKEEVEPRPRWHYVAWVSGAVLLIGLLVYGGFSLFRTRQEGKRDTYMADALKDLERPADPPLPPAEAPLFRAALHVAAGEYAARQDDDKQLDAARKHFAEARKELEAAPATPGRDMVLAELASAQVNLGGDDDQVARGVRYRWVPPARDTRARGEGKVYTVVQELQDTLTAMRRDDKRTPFDVRTYTLRRLTRELARRGQPDLTRQLVPTGFADTEQAEAEAQVALEALRAAAQRDKVAEKANELKAVFEEKGKGTPPSAVQALWVVTDVKGPNMAGPPAGSDAVSDASRVVYTLADLAQNKDAEALALASRPGSPESRLAALAYVAEAVADPGPAVSAAQEALAAAFAAKLYPSDFLLVRLAIQAGRANRPDLVDAFSKAVRDPGYRAWAKGEGLHQRLARVEKPTDEGEAELPADPKEARVGQAWGRLAVARHNARAGDNLKLAVARIEQWGHGTFTPFGLAGLALGLQDRDQK